METQLLHKWWNLVQNAKKYRFANWRLTSSASPRRAPASAGSICRRPDPGPATGTTSPARSSQPPAPPGRPWRWSAHPGPCHKHCCVCLSTKPPSATSIEQIFFEDEEDTAEFQLPWLHIGLCIAVCFVTSVLHTLRTWKFYKKMCYKISQKMCYKNFGCQCILWKFWNCHVIILFFFDLFP